MSKPVDNRPQASSGQIPIPRAERGGIKGYFREVSRELKKVEWPTNQETLRLTGVVLAVCAIVTFVIFLMSAVADQLVKVIQGRI